MAAPLLAGFTITLMGLVVDTSNQGIRYRDTALLALMAAVASLIAAIQCAYSARRYMVLPDELVSWWPGVMETTIKGHKTQLRQLQNEQLAHRLLHLQWASRFRFTYHVGIVLMLAGLAIVLIPPDAATSNAAPGQAAAAAGIAPIRWLAVALAGVSAVVEIMWIAATRLNHREPRGRIGALIVAAAGHVVPSYDVRFRDARASLATMQLRQSIRALGLNAPVRKNLDRHLRNAAGSFEKGRRRDAQRALWLFKLLATFQGHFASSGLSSEKAAELVVGADMIVRDLRR